MIYNNLNNMENNSFCVLLNVIPFATYAVDVEIFHVVYINKVLSKEVYVPKEEFLWKKIYRQNEKCSWYSIPKLTADEKIINTFFDESADITEKRYKHQGFKPMENLLYKQIS